MNRFSWLRAAWFALCLIVLACSRLPWNLEEYDQAKQAFVSLEMVEDGHWLMQHTPAGNPATKPPLAGWISAGLFKAAGWWDLAWRLPSLVAGCVLFIAVGRLGRAAGGDAGLWIAEAVFVFNMLTPRIATLVRTDMLLTMLIALSLFVCYRAARDNRALARKEFLWLVLLSAASFLTKGPILYAFLLPALGAFAAWSRDARLLRQALLATLPGLAVFLGWAAYCMRDPAFYEMVVVKEFLGRFSSGEAAPHKSQPVYFYIAQLLPKLLPWSLALLAAVAWAPVRERLNAPGARMLICAIVGPLAVMSFLPSKRVDRIYPIIPPLCVLCATAAPALNRRWIMGTALAAALGWTAYEASVVWKAYRNEDDWLAKFGSKVREAEASRGLRVGLLKTNEEGIYLYLRETRALDRAEAARALKDRTLDAVIVEKRHLAELEKSLGPMTLLLQAGRGPVSPGTLVLATRERAD